MYPDKLSVPVAANSGANVSLTHRWSNLGWGYCPTNIPQWKDKYKVAFALLNKSTEKPAYVFVDSTPDISTWLSEGQKVSFVPVYGSGASFTAEVNSGSEVTFSLPDKNDFTLYQYTITE